MASELQAADFVDRSIEYPEAVRSAVKALRDSKPWRGSWDERFAALAKCVRASCEGMEIEPFQLVHVGRKSGVCQGKVDRRLKRITITGRLSVLTALFFVHEATRDASESAVDQWVRAERYGDSLKWAVTIFAHFFPRSFRNCRLVGGLIVNDGRINE